jgi:hypothetical protein
VQLLLQQRQVQQQLLQSRLQALHLVGVAAVVELAAASDEVPG